LKSRTLKLILLLSIIMLSACVSRPSAPEYEADDTTRQLSDQQALLIEQASQLLELAENSDTKAEQQSYRAQATSLFIKAGETDTAKEQLDILMKQYSEWKSQPGVDAEKTLASIKLLAAEIAVAERNPSMAREIMGDIKPVTQQQQAELNQLQADLDFLAGNYMQAIERRVKLDKQLVDDNDKNRNSQKIWSALSNLSNAQLEQEQSIDPVTRGWLDLARVMRSGQQNISQLENDLLGWGTRYPEHPVSNRFLNDLINDYQVAVSDKKQIAVLLPMQGKLSKVTATIRNGLLSAYYNDSNSSIKPIIKFYDSSNKELNFNQLLQHAIDDGATNIIGPLDKSLIDELLQQSEMEVPVLTLNYSENAFNYTDKLYQFGLSPNDEARQVAELAIMQNKRYAAVYYPDSEWGKRLSSAFTEHYEQLGGKVLTTSNYATTTNDYKSSIRTLLNLEQSSIRRRKLENTIGAITKSEPYRRQDIDMIFLAATSHSARGIMPAFKFHHAGDIAVYSTSHVYSGKIAPDLDRDLNGIVFCDLPWILQNSSPLVETFKQNWPQQENYTRLFALGVDAYHLIYNLDYLQDKDYAFYTGQTGNIQLDDTNRITRKLQWARFSKGTPVPFEPVIDTLDETPALN
jgi:outer membrane PBP1 activator LpoA protein